MQIHEFAILLLSLHQHVEESALAVVGDEAAEEYIRNGYTQGDADDGERSLDQVVHTHGYLAYHAVHVNEGKQGTIHQDSRYHWDDARNGDALVRGVEPVACLDDDDADERRTGKRTDAQTHVETYVAIGWTQVDEVAEANGDDAAHSHNWQQASRNAEDGREAHG